MALEDDERKREEDKRKREAGARIKGRREELRLHQPQVAERVGVTLRAVQAWEAGDSGAKYKNLEKLAEVLKVDPDWIQRGDRGEAPDPFATEDLAQLARIEAKLNGILGILSAPRGEAGRLPLAGGLGPQTRDDERTPERPEQGSPAEEEERKRGTGG